MDLRIAQNVEREHRRAGGVMGQANNSISNGICSNTGEKKYIWFDEEDIIFIRALMEYFLRKNIYIDGFVSDSSECTDVYLFNKKILYYNEIDREKSVVFSKKELEKHLEIQSVVLKGYLDEEVIDNKVLIDEKECFAIQNMGWMRETVKDKKIFIYGFSDRSKRLARIYELLDFNIEGYIDNELYSKQEEKRVITIEELIYE